MQVGKVGDLDQLMPELYDELRRIAARAMRGEREGHTLQPTALVHEAYLRLGRSGSLAVSDRAHVLALAARVMRQVLVDHARARASAKRGGAAIQVTLSQSLAGPASNPVDILALDRAIEKLARLDPAQVKAVELRFIAGLTLEETAEAVGVSLATVKRELAMARAFLARELHGDGSRP